jgi:hypothetical protein
MLRRPRRQLGLAGLGLSVVAGLGAGCANPPPPPPPAPANAIFWDQFDGVRGEWQQAGGVWEVRDGLLLQRSDDPRHANAIRFVQQPRVADATVETRVRT